MNLGSVDGESLEIVAGHNDAESRCRCGWIKDVILKYALTCGKAVGHSPTGDGLPATIHDLFAQVHLHDVKGDDRPRSKVISGEMATASILHFHALRPAHGSL